MVDKIGNESEMVCTCEEEEHKYPVRRLEGLAMTGLRRVRGRLMKNWGEVIRQDMIYLQLT